MPQAQSLRTPGRRLCASLCNRNAHGHLRRAILHENLQENAAPQKLGARFVGACAVEMHTDMSQEQF